MGIDDLWREIIIRPLLNLLVVLYTICFKNMGIAIIVFTVIVRLVTLPLTIKQLRQMKAMTDLQPRMREIQDRYGRDRQRVSQETMRLYREAGVNPVGCLGPLVIQMPILFGLFRVLIQTLYSRPRPPGGAGGEVLRMDSGVPHLHRGAAERVVPVDGPIGTGPDQNRNSGAGVRFDVAPTEDDDDPVDGPASVHEPDDDAVADAADDRVLLLHAAQRPVAVLDSFQRDRHWHPVFHNGVATHIPTVPASGAGACHGNVFVVQL